jgi:hypothetical protein
VSLLQLALLVTSLLLFVFVFAALFLNIHFDLFVCIDGCLYHFAFILTSECMEGVTHHIVDQ